MLEIGEQYKTRYKSYLRKSRAEYIKLLGKLDEVENTRRAIGKLGSEVKEWGYLKRFCKELNESLDKGSLRLPYNTLHTWVSDYEIFHESESHVEKKVKGDIVKPALKRAKKKLKRGHEPKDLLAAYKEEVNKAPEDIRLDKMIKDIKSIRFAVVNELVKTKVDQDNLRAIMDMSQEIYKDLKTYFRHTPKTGAENGKHVH